MDPPQEGDDDVNVVGGMVARLGLSEGGVVRPGAQAELMEQLGLGEGTRVVDLQVCTLLFLPSQHTSASGLIGRMTYRPELMNHHYQVYRVHIALILPTLVHSL
jgi:hypothetical protein